MLTRFFDERASQPNTALFTKRRDSRERRVDRDVLRCRLKGDLA
jgi:hypothetical protein